MAAAPRRLRRRLSGRQHVVVAATRGDSGDRQARASRGTGARHRGGHGQAAGARPGREGLRCRVLV